MTERDVKPFVSAVLAAAGKSEKEDITSKMGKLSKKIENVKYEVYSALHNQYDEFIPNLTATLELSNDVQAVSQDMQVLSERIEREIQSQLNVSATEYQDLSSRLQESNGMLAILDKLVQVHDSLQAVNKGLVQKEFVSCADSLDKINNLLKTPVDQSGDIKILRALQTEYRVQHEKLIFELDGTWKQYVHWALPSDGMTTAGSTVRLKVKCAKDDPLLKNILQGMERVNILQNKLKSFADCLIKYVITPVIMNKNSKIDVNMKSGQSMIVMNSNSGEVASPQETFDHLVVVLDFIYSKIFCIQLNSGGKAMQRLGAFLSSEMLRLIIEHCLAPSIPTNTRDLEPYKVVVKATEEFQMKLLEYELINGDNTELVNYVSNINVLFANKKCQDLLQKARNLMTSEIHNMVRISEKESLADEDKAKRMKSEPLAGGSHLSTNTFKMPDCYISVSVQDLIKLMYETLHEAATSSQQCAVQLFYTVRNMLDLFCSVVPTYHRDSFTKLPQLAALHHNNCLYIAHHLTTLGHQFCHILSEPLHQGAGTTFLDYVPMVRQLGTDCFLAQMSRQKQQLMECLQGANAFSNVAESDTFKSCETERAIKQVLFQLSHLQKVWQEVLPETIYFKAIGTLLNSAIVEIMTCITALEDISADDANILHSVFSIIIDKAPSYFESDNPENNPVAALQKYTPKWNKFRELMLVLNAGLVDISDRWADGKGPLANEFTVVEMRDLIRALFQNTERRSAVLARIK